MSRSSRLFADIHDPLVADLVRSTVRPSAAVNEAVTTPLVASPRAPLAASSHVADRTTRTVGYSCMAIESDSGVPANTYRTLGRLLV